MDHYFSADHITNNNNNYFTEKWVCDFIIFGPDYTIIARVFTVWRVVKSWAISYGDSWVLYPATAVASCMAYEEEQGFYSAVEYFLSIALIFFGERHNIYRVSQ